MAIVRRFDAAPVRASKTPAGFLRGEANVTRTGVFTYRTADGGTRRELRLPEEVFSPRSLQSLAYAPLTLDHPSEAVTAANARAHAIGAVGEAHADGKFVRTPFTVYDSAAIDEVMGGRKRELSCGYSCDLEERAGVYEGERYDAIQRGIVYNHVAIVSRGRAGPEVSIRLDSQDAICVDSDRTDTVEKESNTMTAKIKIDGVEFEVTESCAQAYAQHSAKRDAELAAAKTEADKVKGRADAADAEVARLKAVSTQDAIDARVRERISLVSKASKVLGAEFDASGKSDDEVRRAVIAKHAPKADLTGKSEEYVAARFDHVIDSLAGEESKQVADSVAATRAAAQSAVAATSAAKAREAMIARSRNLWVTPAAK